MVNLKSTGIVRKVDELGRIVLPIELRRTLDIAEKDSLEIYMDGPSIVLKKYQPACIFCDDAKDVIVFHGKNICPKCIRALQDAMDKEQLISMLRPQVGVFILHCRFFLF